MRSGDVRWVWMLAVLAVACERRPSRRVDAPPPAVTPPAGLTPAASAPVGAVVPGCDAGWWPLTAGQRWQWRIERRWADPGTGRARTVVAARDAEVAAVGGGRVARYRVTGWPAPWTEALTVTRVVERDGTQLRAADDGDDRARDRALPIWFELGADRAVDGVERTVTAATAGRPATIDLVWRTLADDLTLRLACGVGPVELGYHHHGTLEELTAVRVAPARPQ